MTAKDPDSHVMWPWSPRLCTGRAEPGTPPAPTAAASDPGHKEGTDSRSASDLGIEPAAGENLLASRHPAHLIIFCFEFLKSLDSGFVVAPLRVSDKQTK